MTKEQILEKLHQDIHLTWKHAFWIMGGIVTAFVGLASTTAVNHSKIADHQKTLDERAPAVIELARVTQELGSEIKARDQFRKDITDRLDRIEDKLDRALDK